MVAASSPFGHVVVGADDGLADSEGTELGGEDGAKLGGEDGAKLGRGDGAFVGETVGVAVGWTDWQLSLAKDH